ncbi:MAG: peptidase [Pedosphaera sp.]|nr:peptidase [Pedosphaera sp.]
MKTTIHIRLIVTALAGFAALNAPAQNKAATAADTNTFLETYNRIYQSLYTVANDAAWVAATDVTEEHTGQRIGAEKAQAAFVGSVWVMERARELLQHTNRLDALTVRQLQRVLLNAAGSPGTLPEVVAERVAAEARQSATLDGFEFKWTPPGGTKVEPLTANKISDILNSSTNLAERLAVWTAAKESGVALKPGLLKLRDLRNRVAHEMGFSSFFGLRAGVSDMSVAEMKALTDKLVADTKPLYEQLHCWAKHKLAARFGQPVPKLIPAHWIGNRWCQEWPGLVDSVDLDPLFKDKSPEWIVQRAVNYGESIGLPHVPSNFWTKSDLYEIPATSKRKKNTHASAWHIDLQNDVRSLMNVKSDAYWFNTPHHELGHIFYQLAYSRPEVPFVLREGASPAMHEAMAEALATAPAQLPYLRQLGLVKPEQKFDEIEWLLNDALDKVVFIPWSAGVMAAWERDFYEGNLPADQLNHRWWEHVAKYQGIAPPEPRGEEFCDAATKTHINDDPAEYYKYSIAFAIKYQLHMHLAKKILHQDPRNCDVAGHKEVGAFLYSIMKQGATKDWRTVIREATGEEFSGRPMLEYFEPLTKYLKEQNKGREVGW